MAIRALFDESHMESNSSENVLVGVDNERVGRSIRFTLAAALALLLASAVLGVLNILRADAIPYWQRLVHLHAGSVGWLTLALIGVALWLMTRDRAVSRTYERGVDGLAGATIVAFSVYVFTFGLAFSRGDEFYLALVMFGTISTVLIWLAALWFVRELFRLESVSTVHLLVAAGLVVAGVGAIMGVLLGLRFRGIDVFPAGAEPMGSHAAMMDVYLLLVAAGLLEWFSDPRLDATWTWPGAIQTAVGTIAAIIVPVALFFDMADLLLPIFGLLVLLFILIFLGRIGRPIVSITSRRTLVSGWVIAGFVWLLVFVAMFLYIVLGLQGQVEDAPEWYLPVFAHVTFIGTMTNLLFGVYSGRTSGLPGTPWAELGALVLVNLGLLFFIGARIPTGVTHGAFTMALGVLLAIGVFGYRLASE